MTIRLHKYERELDNMRTMMMYYGAEIIHDWYYNGEDYSDGLGGICGRHVTDPDFDEEQ